MNFKLLLTLTFTFFIINYMEVNYDDGVYQINKLEYSYTSGYGMNQDVRYIIDCEDDCKLIIKEYEKSEDDIKTIKLSKKDMDAFENMLNKNHILSWKGFSKSDKNVLDGDSFNFHLRYNDDEKLSASGYMMYPSKYDSFKKQFEDYISKLNK